MCIIKQIKLLKREYLRAKGAQPIAAARANGSQAATLAIFAFLVQYLLELFFKIGIKKFFLNESIFQYLTIFAIFIN